MYTKSKRNGLLFRAHPCYKEKTCWQDWAYIDWAEDGHIPAQLLIFVDLNGLHTSFMHNGMLIDTKGVYALAHTMEECLDKKPHYMGSEEGNYRVHQASKLVYFAEKELKEGHSQPSLMENTKKRRVDDCEVPNPNGPRAKIYFIECDAIKSECIGVPDYGSDRYHGYFIVRSRNEWLDICLKLME